MEDLLEAFQSFYFDTALLSGTAALPSLQAFAAPGHILYGTDFTYAPPTVSASFTEQLDSYLGLSADEHTAINNGNAKSLFKRLR